MTENPYDISSGGSLVRQSSAATFGYQWQIAVNGPVLLDYGLPGRAYCDRLIGDTRNYRTTVHEYIVHPAHFRIIKLIMDVTRFNNDGPLVRHHPSADRIECEPRQPKSPIPTRLLKLWLRAVDKTT